MTLDKIEESLVELKRKFRKTLNQSTTDRNTICARLSMRTFLAPGVISLIVGLSGCMIVDSPIKGILGTEVIWGDIATGKSGSPTPDESKEGKACAESILGLLARGDASVRAAKENGNITEVTSVDHSAKNLLNIFAEWCTIVKGH